VSAPPQASADLLVVAAHPDDLEIHCAGTIRLLVRAGRRVELADLTRGEKGTRGDPATRARECAAATQRLGAAARHNLELPDTELTDDARATAALIGLIRRVRPRLLFAPWTKDLHPDHEAAGRLARRAYFHAGLRQVHPDLGPPFRPALVAHFPGHVPVEPTFCVDIGEVAAEKLEIVGCYASQIAPAERTHLVRGLDPLERARASDAFWGARVGCRAAEPFVVDGPFRLQDLVLLLPEVKK
jgi:bacillithiol biosynthesis deacetylase BshB1